MFHKKALIIRFSSFGDIVQASFAAQSLSQKGYDVHLITKKEFSEAFSKKNTFNYSLVHAFDKNKDSLWKLSEQLQLENYDLIYDAHNNQRTFLLKTFLLLRSPLNFFKFKTRSKYRLKRFLLFKMRINLFPKPFKGALSFLKPLKLNTFDKTQKEITKKLVLLAPSAAWELKKWPREKWVDLAKKLKNENLDVTFIGGPGDDFIQDISKSVAGSKNLAGKLTWTETIDLIKKAQLLISGDTGVLHVADFFGVSNIGLMGPSAFGRTTRDTSKEIFKDLPCQPCSKDGRGKCKIKDTKKCLTSISVDEVFTLSNKIMSHDAHHLPLDSFFVLSIFSFFRCFVF